jgi:hypothetical protein
MNKDILKYCLSRGLLLDKEILEFLSQIEENLAEKIVERINSICNERVITKSCLTKNQSRMQEAFSDMETGNKRVVEKFFVNLGFQIEVRKERIEEPEKKRSQKRKKKNRVLR